MRKPFMNGGVIYFEGGLKVTVTSYQIDSVTIRVERGKYCKRVTTEMR